MGIIFLSRVGPPWILEKNLGFALDRNYFFGKWRIWRYFFYFWRFFFQIIWSHCLRLRWSASGRQLMRRPYATRLPLRRPCATRRSLAPPLRRPAQPCATPAPPNLTSIAQVLCSCAGNAPLSRFPDRSSFGWDKINIPFHRILKGQFDQARAG